MWWHELSPEAKAKQKKIHNSSLWTALYHAEACFQQFFRLRCTGRPPLQTWFSFLSPIHLSCQAVVKHLLAIVKIVQPCRLKGFSVLIFCLFCETMNFSFSECVKRSTWKYITFIDQSKNEKFLLKLKVIPLLKLTYKHYC